MTTNQLTLAQDELAQVRHLFMSGNPQRSPLVLLHGTGGDETSLIEVARFLAPDHPILAIRGRVVEKGYYRYFKRQAVGHFDLVSLAEETRWLVAALTGLAERYHLTVANMTAVGFSNGANIALHALLTQLEMPFQRVIAYHAMQLTEVGTPTKFSGSTSVFDLWRQDPLVTQHNLISATGAISARAPR